VVDYLERSSYNYSVSKGYINDTLAIKRLSMSFLFDMIAGTSTGSILSTALTAPMPDNKTEPGFYADKIFDLYDK
jgi:patatin-like phospholipase/acyl hydrolase